MRALATARLRFGYGWLHSLLTRELWLLGGNKVHRPCKL
jgi:hypothetical protein